jgi:hypothetical protein
MDVAPKHKTTLRERIAQLVRQLGTPERGVRVNAWRFLESTMDGAGINWSDVGNWIEQGGDDGAYTEDELQQFGQARHAEGVEAGIKIGEARKSSGNGHLMLPSPKIMAEYCHQRTNRMKNDWQRDFVADLFVITRSTEKLSSSRLANLAKIYIEIGGRI